MTLIVARVEKGRLAIAADTMLSAHGTPLSMQEWALKSFCLPGNICVSYSGSPELAAKAFHAFRKRHPQGANYTTTLEFFEASSLTTNNDYIVAFSDPAKLVTIRDGRRTNGLSKTHWIGDKYAYERFRQYEHRQRLKQEHGRAVNAALFADEMTGSPASELYSTMRNVLQDRDVPTVGGLVTVLSNRDIGFRFSVYSDVLLDWPAELGGNQLLKLTDKFDLRVSGENDRYSISQISPGYYNMNAVAFYVLKGRLLIVFFETEEGGSTCVTFGDVEPNQISARLDEKLGFPFRAMCLVMSAREEYSLPLNRVQPEHGLGMNLFCEINTMPAAS
ncbi:MAG: hypothetical protein RIE84_09390 [Parvibaculum sp.]|uniref:hypothetical protein n=2 Tax=Parvibaculum sp. TaxID=2024848 RepID=UPI0032EAC0A3